MRRLRGLGALLVLGLVLVGAPVALARWGYPPAGWAALARPDDGALLLWVLTAVGWVAWAAFTVSVIVELVALIRGARHRLRIPLLSRLQQLSAGLLLAVLALAPRATDPAPEQASVLFTDPGPGPRPTPPTVPGPDVDALPAYLVQPGDDLWTVSERTLGDGSRWRDLVAANPELLKDPTTHLAPGSRLLLPASAGRSPQRVSVERGDTLSGLALEHLGAAGRWPRIAAANRDLIEDPDHIEVGWRLDLPADAHPTRPESHHPDNPHAKSPPTTKADPPQAGVADEDPIPEVVPGGGATFPAPRPAAPTTVALPSAPDDQRALPLVGTIGSLAAAAIIGVIETRRFLRLRDRPVGRRLLSPEEGAARLRTALGSGQRPDRLAVLDAALRAIGRHCQATGLPLPELARIIVGDDRIEFEWAASTDPPPTAFAGNRDRWTVDIAAPPDTSDHPCPYPAVVSLGSTPDGALVLVDVERSGVLGVASADPELRRSSIAAMTVELACAPWSADVRLEVAGADAALVRLAGGDRVQVHADAASAIASARAQVGRRRVALGAQPLAAFRVDPDRADAVGPVLLCLLDETPPDVVAELEGMLAGTTTGVAAIVATVDESAAQWHVGGPTGAPTGHLAGAPGQLFAHAIPRATRDGVAGLLRAADDPSTTPAPWWSGADPDGHDNVVALPQRAHPGGDDMDVVRLVPRAGHPQVLLIGPTELTGAPGPEPSRSRQQLVELCAWLLEHPGSTATAMAAGLGVAEGTRRSNLSRLRAWLGTAADGTPYLPDAYSGRVLLHPGITSDWQSLQLLLRPGIDRVGESTLVAALELVRGAMLADAAPGQWHWAEELRTDVSSALRDAGVVLTERALASGDIDLARWAASRALVVAAEDELLLCARIRTEHRAGNAAEVERLVNQVTRQARLLGVDLFPETVQLCQQVIEGRVRARA